MLPLTVDCIMHNVRYIYTVHIYAVNYTDLTTESTNDIIKKTTFIFFDVLYHSLLVVPKNSDKPHSRIYRIYIYSSKITLKI